MHVYMYLVNFSSLLVLCTAYGNRTRGRRSQATIPPQARLIETRLETVGSRGKAFDRSFRTLVPSQPIPRFLFVSFLAQW